MRFGHFFYPMKFDETRDEREIQDCLLISFGANLQQMGINGFTPLHCAAADNDLQAIELLLSHGADPDLKTDVDDFTTPLEEAKSGGCAVVVQIPQKVTTDGKVDGNK